MRAGIPACRGALMDECVQNTATNVRRPPHSVTADAHCVQSAATSGGHSQAPFPSPSLPFSSSLRPCGGFCWLPLQTLAATADDVNDMLARWGLCGAAGLVVAPERLELLEVLQDRGLQGQIWKGRLEGKDVAVKALPVRDGLWAARARTRAA
eukprot:361866-Chlamydomonas_euryale.AAC.4